MGHFRLLLKLQAFWLTAGISFHVVSLIRVQLELGALSVNPPLGSIIGMSAFIPVIYIGWKLKYLLYGILNGVLISVIFYQGYLFQVLAIFHPDGLAAFPSVPAWFAGVAINTLGVPLGIYASYRAFRLALAHHKDDLQNVS